MEGAVFSCLCEQDACYDAGWGDCAGDGEDSEAGGCRGEVAEGLKVDWEEVANPVEKKVLEEGDPEGAYSGRAFEDLQGDGGFRAEARSLVGEEEGNA